MVALQSTFGLVLSFSNDLETICSYPLNLDPYLNQGEEDEGSGDGDKGQDHIEGSAFESNLRDDRGRDPEDGPAGHPSSERIYPMVPKLKDLISFAPQKGRKHSFSTRGGSSTLFSLDQYIGKSELALQKSYVNTFSNNFSPTDFWLQPDDELKSSIRFRRSRNYGRDLDLKLSLKDWIYIDFEFQSRIIHVLRQLLPTVFKEPLVVNKIKSIAKSIECAERCIKDTCVAYDKIISDILEKLDSENSKDENSSSVESQISLAISAVTAAGLVIGLAIKGCVAVQDLFSQGKFSNQQTSEIEAPNQEIRASDRPLPDHSLNSLGNTPEIRRKQVTFDLENSTEKDQGSLASDTSTEVSADDPLF